MNVLMDRVNKTSGKVMMNGTNYSLKSIKKLIGYVPQDDIMIRELTVAENIYYSASTRLPKSFTSSQIKEFADAVIEILGLGHVQHSIIGDETNRGISGGQRKRVNIGMELASAPTIIFGDEITTGLDSTSAMVILKSLKKVASMGVTIVSVIHQPRYN